MSSAARRPAPAKPPRSALPILSKLGKHNPVGPRALILEPTRELASQVETAIRDYARFTDLKVTVVYGGVGYGKQNDELRAGADIVVATPGRLLDHLEQGTVRLDKVEFLVLDEADRMLDMGFLPDVRRLVEKCPQQSPHLAVFRHHSAADRNAHPMGDAQSGDD